MKEHDIKLTLQEIEHLCRLYMNCRLTVLEETELQYILGKLPYSSPCIDEVRMMMEITISPDAFKTKKKPFNFFRNRIVINIAASITILFIVGTALLFNHNAPSNSSSSKNNIKVYIAAYNHGECLKGSEAIIATNIAMAKADSLMKYASITECDYMRKANDIISATINN